MRIWAANRVIKPCSGIPIPHLHHRGWLSTAQSMLLHQQEEGVIVFKFALVQVHKSYGMRPQALLGFLNNFTALFHGNWEKSSDSRMLQEFCSNLAQTLIPITHQCQVELITLSRNNWPESNSSKKSCVFKRKKTSFLGSSCCRAVPSGWGYALRDPEGQKFRTCIPVWQTDSTACKRPW